MKKFFKNFYHSNFAYLNKYFTLNWFKFRNYELFFFKNFEFVKILLSLFIKRIKINKIRIGIIYYLIYDGHKKFQIFLNN
jgi:hypothetical protein